MKILPPLLMIFFLFSFEAVAKNSSIQNLQRGMNLRVINVDAKDKLNLRKAPTYKSKLIVSIPHNSTTLRVAKGMVVENKKSKWVNIDYCIRYSDSCFNGWVNSKFITSLIKHQTIKTNKLFIKYPSFLDAKKVKGGWIEFSHTIPYKHEQWANGKDGEKSYNTYPDFILSVKYYSSLEFALKDNYIENYNLNGEYDPEGPIQKIENGYKIRTGVEGVGSFYYIIIRQNGILVFDSPYNINPIKSLQKDKPLNFLSTKKKEELEKSIIKNTIIKIRKKEKPKKPEPAPQTKLEPPKPVDVAKPALNTIPPKNAENIKAEKAEPIKTATGSPSLVFLSTLLGLLAWRLS